MTRSARRCRTSSPRRSPRSRPSRRCRRTTATSPVSDGAHRPPVRPPGGPRWVGDRTVPPGSSSTPWSRWTRCSRPLPLALRLGRPTLGTWVGRATTPRCSPTERLRAASGTPWCRWCPPRCCGSASAWCWASILHRVRVRGLCFFRTGVSCRRWRRWWASPWRGDASTPPTAPSTRWSARSASSRWTLGMAGADVFALPAVGLVGTRSETGLVTVLLLAGMAAHLARPRRGRPARRRGAGARVLRPPCPRAR